LNYLNIKKCFVAQLKQNYIIRRIFSRGQTFFLKNNKKHNIFLKKVQKHTILGWPWQEKGGGARGALSPHKTPMIAASACSIL
jgi:hypothetical protein